MNLIMLLVPPVITQGTGNQLGKYRKFRKNWKKVIEEMCLK
jgi:hypothetical protein